MGLTTYFSGCLYSTHHFNAGKTLAQGRTQITLGMGRQPLWKCVTVAGLDTLSDKSNVCGDNVDRGLIEAAEVSQLPKASLSYNLGVRNHWGPFPGVEIGWHLEMPTNPASMEFYLKLALPKKKTWKMHHGFSGGWGIGIWADNSFFAEYALSYPWKNHLPFLNIRGTYLATQVGDVLNQDFEQRLVSNQSLVIQLGSGIVLGLPPWFLVPDRVIPALNLTFPQVASGDSEFRRKDVESLLWDINLGLGWNF